MACCVVGCRSGYRSDVWKTKKTSFHRFPKQPGLRAAWIRAIERKDWNPSPYSVVCGKHFEERCLIKLQYSTVLLEESIPTIFPTYSEYFGNSQKNFKNIEPECNNGSCFVHGCPTNLYTYGKRKRISDPKNLSLFYPPHDWELFKKWKRAVPRGHAELTSSDRICELHFTEDDIERYYAIKLPDGSVNKMKRQKIILKQGAVPHFSDLPAYLTEGAIKMKQLIIQNSDDVIMPISTENLENYTEEKEVDNILHFQNEENETNNIIFLQNEENETGQFLHLQNEINNILHLQNESLTKNFKIAVGAIQAPNPWWRINSTPEFIICTKWSASFSPEKKVVIDQDLNAKVFIKDFELQTDKLLSVSTIGDISCLLQQVDFYEICAGIDDESMTNCRRFMKRVFSRGRYSSWCKNCQIEKRKMHKTILQRKRREIKKFRKMQCFACALAKNCPKVNSRDSSFTSTVGHIMNTVNSVVVAECLISGDSCK